MDLSYIINTPSISDTEAADVLCSMSTIKETYNEAVPQNIFWKLYTPPPVTYVRAPVKEEMYAIQEEIPTPSTVTKTYPRRVRHRPRSASRLSVTRLSAPNRTPKPPAFKRSRETRFRNNPLGMCQHCRGLYVVKHMERHQATCDGTLKWCRYTQRSIEDYQGEYLEKYPDKELDEF